MFNMDIPCSRLLKTSRKLRQLDIRGCEKITHRVFSVSNGMVTSTLAG